MTARSAALTPDPSPIGRGEKKTPKEGVQHSTLKLQTLSPNPSPRGRGEKSSNLVEHFLSIVENLLIG